MKAVLRVTIGLTGLASMGAGVLYGVLGVWGLERRGSGAVWLTVLGVGGVLLGAWLLSRAVRGTLT